ncbi:hypothetical protein CON45_31200, partial [Priestia megaterium]
PPALEVAGHPGVTDAIAKILDRAEALGGLAMPVALAQHGVVLIVEDHGRVAAQASVVDVGVVDEGRLDLGIQR